LIRVGSDWMFDEFGPGAGVSSVGLEERVPGSPTEAERNSILDLFKR
jgi:penicillin-binding protein 1A